MQAVSTGTSYAKTPDGVHLAYQVSGDGPVDLLLLPTGFIPFDAMLEEPALARFIDELGRFARVIRFDLRGVGLSDPVLPSDPPTLEQWTDDALTVLDAVGSPSAAVFGASEHAKVAVLLAASHPERVRALVLVNAFVSAFTAADAPFGLATDDLDEMVDAFVDPDGAASGFDYLELAAPEVARDPTFRTWWDRAGNRGASPSTARALMHVTLGVDVSAVVPAVSVPTLVVHRIDNRALSIHYSRELAERIRDARLVELPGHQDLYWLGDAAGLLAEVEEHLTGTRRAPDADRVLLSVLFTDVVGSTEQAARLGDTEWRRLLEEHDAAVRRELVRHAGREVKTTGDGFLATFDGPARAVRCACAVRDRVADLGIPIRAGIHIGEVELRGDDIAGIAVHIGQRVTALAGPGEVFVTRTLVDLVGGSGLRFDDRGMHALKGIPDPWHVYAVAG
jgi:class 3 adenylate cyclase